MLKLRYPAMSVPGLCFVSSTSADSRIPQKWNSRVPPTRTCCPGHGVEWLVLLEFCGTAARELLPLIDGSSASQDAASHGPWSG
ncbi:hypothetical protein H113_02187 [Trichophyton rubrum MR1459]|uniref:Uncharacterized protein n=1 Tax=Trichophyton soudanense CBS 452.61 TaxID=1215331 RepID=A0A022Y1L7_TRISD|nr:hypothetical protein H105_02198 [Trichophyton soudanense CBS 452.61]EZF97993.1 hypothetical protein H113_02187 [Trichophyton rubrum MR1459]EZG08863.1 hypothetical protein H106_02047 [Trichophyton rubrum CBS 735.88]